MQMREMILQRRVGILRKEIKAMLTLSLGRVVRHLAKVVVLPNLGVSDGCPAVTSNWAVCCTLNPPVLPPIPPEGVKVPGCLFYLQGFDSRGQEENKVRTKIARCNPELIYFIYLRKEKPTNSENDRNLHYGGIRKSSPAKYIMKTDDDAFVRVDAAAGAVGTTLDIFQNIILIPYLEYGVLILSGYGVLIIIPLWSLVGAGTDTPYLP
ncbi:hypothetical protein Tco_1229119 [Tanacetum coccineum]